MGCERRCNSYYNSLHESFLNIKHRYDAMVLEDVKEESEQKGRKEGKQEGRKEGKLESKMEDIICLYENGISKNKIAAFLKLDKAFVDAIIKNEPNLRNNKSFIDTINDTIKVK